MARPFLSHASISISFLANSLYEIFRRFLIWIVSAGPMPKHVAIIMDGNRRYATMRNMNKSKGQEFGYNNLMDTLRDCFDLGIKYVSVYAFSIENFRRSKEEVETLMNLMHQKLEALIEEESMVNQNGIRVQILGDLSLLPEHVRRAAERAMEFSRGNDVAVLNICAPYTATQEIVKAVEDLVVRAQEIQGKEKKKKKIVEEIERGLYTSNCPEPEVLIRTSGETRLSNFLLWQTPFSLLYATPVLWPEFSLWPLIRAVVEYQKAHAFLQEKRKEQRTGISHEHYD